MVDKEDFIAGIEADGFVRVKGPFKWNFDSWSGCNTSFKEDLALDVPFQYSGNGLNVIVLKSNFERGPNGSLTTCVNNRIFSFQSYQNANQGTVGTPPNRARWGYAGFPLTYNEPVPLPLGSSGTFEILPRASTYSATSALSQNNMMR